MKKVHSLFATGLILFLIAGSLHDLALAAKQDAAKKRLPARINFSGNLEGELEPCG